MAAVAGVSALAGRVAVERLAGVRLEPWPGLVTAVAALDDGVPLAIGPPAAAVRVHVFADYTCAACARLERVTGDSLRALASAGLIRLEHHHAPILRRRAGVAHHILSCGAAAGEPWRAHVALYATLPAWSRAADPAPAARAVLRSIGVHDCLAPPGDDRGRQLSAAAVRAGIRDVPAVAVDGMRVRYRRSEALLSYISRRAGGR